MAEIKIINFYDKDKIYSFLKHAGYRKFNLWPGISDKNITDFLFKEINEIQGVGKIFVASQFDKITSLLAVKPMDWDSQHYGFKCAKIEYILTNKTLSNAIVDKSLEVILVAFQKYCIEFNIKFVCVNVDSCDFTMNLALQKSGFRYILSWIGGVFKSTEKLPEITEAVDVGVIKPNEIGCFKRISSLFYFKRGRFYLDTNFNRELVDKMYAALITFSYKNNYIMLVYRIKNQPVGLFICEKIATYESFSGLLVAPLRFLVINPEFRTKKVAYNLFIKTLGYLKDKSDLITTELDATNLLSLNLHSKVGFKFNYTHNVYHWWNINL